jgi:hypothetical protein
VILLYAFEGMWIGGLVLAVSHGVLVVKFYFNSLGVMSISCFQLRRKDEKKSDEQVSADPGRYWMLYEV